MKNLESIEAVHTHTHTHEHILIKEFIDTCLSEKTGIFFHTQKSNIGNKS